MMKAAEAWMGHKPYEIALAINAIAKAEIGKVVPMKALLAVAAVEGVAKANELLAIGAVELAAGYVH